MHNPLFVVSGEWTLKGIMLKAFLFLFIGMLYNTYVYSQVQNFRTPKNAKIFKFNYHFLRNGRTLWPDQIIPSEFGSHYLFSTFKDHQFNSYFETIMAKGSRTRRIEGDRETRAFPLENFSLTYLLIFLGHIFMLLFTTQKLCKFTPNLETSVQRTQAFILWNSLIGDSYNSGHLVSKFIRIVADCFQNSKF